MADIEIKNLKKKKGVRKLMKKRLAVDLTPMVDLGFLLITFFILTTSLAKPTITKLYMPKDDTAKTLICESCVLTVLPVGNNELYYYAGMVENNTIAKKITYSTLREILQEKKQEVQKIRGTDADMVIIIKPGKKSSYKNLLDILDEISINDIKHYFLSEKEDIDKKLAPDD